MPLDLRFPCANPHFPAWSQVAAHLFRWALWALVMLVPWIAASRAAAAEGVAPSAVGTSSALRFSIIKTGEVQTREGLAVAGGSLAKQVMLNHVAILIERDNERVLFDTGLGERIDQQFVDDMPWWGKMFFKYNRLKSARQQMLDAGLPPPSRIVLSHGHWDHASGVVAAWVLNAPSNALAASYATKPTHQCPRACAAATALSVGITCAMTSAR